MSEKARLLIIDDERIALRNIEHVMKKEGYEVVGTQSGQVALSRLEEEVFDVVLTDLRMEKVDGMEILRKCRELDRGMEVVMITGYASLDSAVEAIKNGAFYYIAKPYKFDEVRKVVKEAVEKVRLKRENSQLREQIETFKGKVTIITKDAKMLELLETAKQIAPTDCNVIISGESGTGKELFARYLHHNSHRSAGPFSAINCGAFTEELLANELFGHERGAYTGASSGKKGLVEMASDGTLFLDEITEMPLSMQVKLLRVSQERELLRVGGTEPIKVNARFIAATNRNIEEAIEQGVFRRDLYFRLNVVSIQLPPLSERRDDMPLLCAYFVQRCSSIMKRDVREVSPEVISLLMSYSFPGNVRELENIIERGVALSTGPVMEVSQLPEHLRELDERSFRKKDGKILSLDKQEMAYIKWVLGKVGGNKTLGAQLLGIDRVSLWRKLKKYGNDAE